MSHRPKILLSLLTGLFLVSALFVEKVSAKAVSLTIPQTTTIVPLGQMPRSPFLLTQQSNFRTFFEEGRLPSENRLRRPSPDPTIPVAQNSQAWQPIFFQSGGFSFWMPPGTLSEATVVLPTQVGDVSFRTLTANSDSDRYVVGYADQLTQDQLKNPQLLLNAITNKVVGAQNFKLVRNQSITQSGIQGRELLYQSDTEVIVFRVFLRRDRAHVIGARSPKSEGVPPRKTTIFLSSFEFMS